jgi:rubrerythrin
MAILTEERVSTARVLDAAIEWKTLTSHYYEFLSKVVVDPIMKQRFRLMGTEERDHRKILRKYRRDLCGTPYTPLPDRERLALRERFIYDEVNNRPALTRAVEALLKAEERSYVFFSHASKSIDSREGRIFLRLLAEEGLVHKSMVEQLMEYASRKEIRFSKNSAAIAAAARR